MTQIDPDRRFQAALDRARTDWAAADPLRCAALAGCDVTPEGIRVQFFNRLHLVTHPSGEAFSLGAEPASGQDRPKGAPPGKPAHLATVISLLHYLLSADGTPPADNWLAFRELPDGLFYAQAFAGHAEGEIAARFGNAGALALQEFRRAAAALGGSRLDLADASFRFQALPRLAVAALIWAGDDEFPGQARILFDAHASHYLPTEDLAGIGDWLAHHLVR